MHAVYTVEELWAYLPEEQKLRPLEMGLREGMIQGTAADLPPKAPCSPPLWSILFHHSGYPRFLAINQLSGC